MTAFRINDAEFEVLKSSELSHPARLVYLLGVRPHMDFSTRIVGKVRRISYQGLHEILEYIPLPGSQRAKADFSQRALRCLIDELERIGLVRRIPNDERALFLECLLADREDAPKKRNVRGTSERSDRGTSERKPRRGADFSSYEATMNGRPDERRSVTPPVSGKPIGISNAAALQTAAVDNFAALRFDEISVWLKSVEKRREKTVAIVAGDTQIKSWVSREVRTEELEEAYALAVADREKQQTPAPIHVGFLDIFIGRVLKKRKPWFKSWQGLVAEGARRGVFQQHEERDAHFADRVYQAAGMTREEAAKWEA